MEFATTSPKVMPKGALNFYDALKEVAIGKKITKIEWENEDDYGILKDSYLMLHKKGEPETTFHQWILRDADLTGEDWKVIE